jgi:polygalacturonase
MNAIKIKRILQLILVMQLGLHSTAKDYRVSDFGARADGITLNTCTIQSAIDFIHENGGGRLIFDAGNYLTGSIYLKSDVTLQLNYGATLLGSTNPWDYIKDKKIGWMSMIFAVKQENIGITGKGTINGRGFVTANNMVAYIHRGIYTDPLKLDRPNETNRPQNIYFRECRNVTVTGITLRDPASWNQTYDQCKKLYVADLYVDSKSYWNNDGIDVVDCDSVEIRNCFFDAADDVICFKSHDAKSICQNVVVDNCVGRSSANGLKFGTVSRGGFRNFKITNLTIFDTFRSAITFAAVDGGEIENIVVDGVRSINTGNVIYLRIGDRWSQGKKPFMKDIFISNVYAEVPYGKPDAGYNYEGPVEDLPRNVSPASIVGLPDHKIQNVKLKNIEIVYPGGGNPLYAKRGLTPTDLDSIPEMRTAYPEFSQFKELPAWGFYLRHAEGIEFENVTLRARVKDYRPAIVIDDITRATFKEVKFDEPESGSKQQIFQYKSEGVSIQ